MLLAALYRLILEMRASAATSPFIIRTQASLLATGLRRADLLYPRIAPNIRADDAGARTILDVAAKAIVGVSTFTDAWEDEAPPYTLSAAILGFLDNAMTAPPTPG